MRKQSFFDTHHTSQQDSQQDFQRGHAHRQAHMMAEPPTKKPRTGGIRQRIKQCSQHEFNEDHGQEGKNNDDVESKLINHLLADFAWGVQSAQKLQAIAMSSLKDLKQLRKRIVQSTCEPSSSSSSSFPAGAPSSTHIERDVEMVATIGCSGQYQNKCYADLMARIEPNISLPKPYRCSLKFSGSLGEQPQEILLPHQLLSAFYKSPKFWKHVVLPDENQPLEFWKAQRMGKHPQWDGHPLQGMDDSALSKIIPVSLHGDEVPVTGIGKQWSKKMVNWSWHSMLSYSASVKQSQFFIWSIFDKAGVDEGSGGYSTLHRFFEILKWSFFFMCQGVWPTHDVDGKPQIALTLVVVFETVCILFLNCVFFRLAGFPVHVKVLQLVVFYYIFIFLYLIF